MKKRFSSYLLMGKVATLPGLATKAMAANPPDYTDLTTSQLSVVPLPAAGQVALTSSQYGNVPTLCVDHGAPSTMSVVVTGVLPGDQVFLGAAINSHDPSLTQLSPNFVIGSNKLTIIDSFQNNETTLVASASGGTRTEAVKFSVSLSKLQAAGFTFPDQSKFYLQAIIEPQTATGLAGTSGYWAALRYSPLVTVTADAGTSPSSVCYGY